MNTPNIIGPKQGKALLDKYRSATILTMALLICSATFAQVDTTKPYNPPSKSNFQYDGRLKATNAFIGPTDTFRLAVADTGALASKNGVQYVYRKVGSLLKWWPMTGSGGGSDITYFENGPGNSELDTILRQKDPSTFLFKAIGTDLPTAYKQIGNDSNKYLIRKWVKDSVTYNIVDASPGVRGLLSDGTTDQTVDGRKIWLTYPVFADIKGMLFGASSYTTANRPSLFTTNLWVRPNADSSYRLEIGNSIIGWKGIATTDMLGAGGGNGIYGGSGSLPSSVTVSQGGFSLGFTGVRSGAIQSITNSLGKGLDIFSQTDGANIVAQNGFGINAQSNGTDPIFYGTNERAATNTAVETFTTKRTTSGTPAAGIGQFWGHQGANTSGTTYYTGKFKSWFTDVGAGTEKSKLAFTGLHNGVESDWLTLGNNGAVQLNSYGTGAKTGTAAYTLQVDASGNVIEGSAAGGGGSTYKRTYFDIYANGADTTGATDISTIVSGAFAAGYRMIYMRKGTYLISSTIQIPDSAVIVGDGPTNTRLKLATNITAFKAGFALGGDGAQFRDFSLEGTRGSGGNSSQKGIVLDSVKQVVVENCSFYFLGDYAVIVKNNGLLSGNNYTYGNKIRNCYGETNGGGIQFDVRGEYNSVVGTTFAGGAYGIRIAGGNNVITGSNFSANTYNVYLETGANDGHGSFSATTMNHAGTANIYATGLVNGFEFSGCMVYAGNISILNSTGVGFNGGHISVTTITITTSPSTTFNNVYFPTAPTWTVTGTVPLILKSGNASTGLNIYDGVNAKNFYIDHVNTVASFGDNTMTRFNFYGGTVVTKSGGNYDANRGLSTGAFRGDYAGSPSITDPFQVFNSSTTGSRWAVLGNTGYAFKVENGNQSGFRVPTASAMVHIAGSGSAANLGQLKLNPHHVLTTAASGTGSTATLTFAAQPVAPFAVGSTIVVSGVTPSGYNGTYTVTACNTTTVSYASATTGSQTVVGKIGSMLATPEDGVIEYNPNSDRLHWTNSTAVRGDIQVNRVITSAAGTLTLDLKYSDYVFTGTTTTWTLPAVSGSANVVYYIKNRGSGSITLNTNAAANEIYDASAVNTLTITAGSSLMLRSDGTYFNKF